MRKKYCLIILSVLVFSLTACSENVAEGTIDITLPVSDNETSDAIEEEPNEPIVTTEHIDIEEIIEFETEEIADNDYYWGQSRILQSGENEIRIFTYEITYEDNNEVSKELISESIIKESVSKIIGNGTLVINFKNCTELKEVYPGGVTSESPVYQKKYDRDGDGHVCE